MDIIEFLNASKFNGLKDGIEEELEVSDGDAITMKKVGSSNGEDVRHCWLNSSEQGFSFLLSNLGNFSASFHYLNDVTVILRKPLKRGGSDLRNGF